MEHADCIVVGAGVIGLAVARAIAQTGREVLVIEANERFGAETSSRNNEVIHAGFLYLAGSLKAGLCRAGRDQLYRYCGDRGINHRRIGKLMIATSEQERDVLRQLAASAPQHGVDDLIWLESAQARAIEPNLHCQAALQSPSTGIVDAHGLMMALLADAEAAGAAIAYRTRVTRGRYQTDRLVIEAMNIEGATHELSCRILVNAAGLGALDIARSLCGQLPKLPEIVFAKGNFFNYSGHRPFDTLIVPVGDTLSGGGAFTIDAGGQGKFGPDLEIVGQVDYAVAPARAEHFVASIRRYYPDIDPSRLTPNYSGIRPRVRGPSVQSDWLVLTPSEHGLSGTYHLLGFDTPGLTSCLAVADHVVQAIKMESEGSCRVTASAK